MLKRLSTALLFFLIWATTFAQFSDDFSDLDFTNNPTWSGQDTNFVIDTNSVQLRLLAPAVTASSYLSTSSVSIYNATWQFKVFLNFNPSGSNYAQVYLVADAPDLSNNGYFVRIGNTTDEVSLYRQSGGTETEIIDGTDDLVDVAAPELFIKVTRDSVGNWELFADTSLSGNYVSQGVISDNTFSTSNYFGVLCEYTSTRSDKFYFDDFIITGTSVLDTDPPTFDSVKVTSANQLKLFFNEALNSSTTQNLNNYSVSNGVGNPTSANISGAFQNEIDLTFTNNFPANQTLQIQVQNLEDTSGNILSISILNFQFIQVDIPQYQDVLINEFMADPSPPNNLPDAEFIELWNFSSKTFDLKNWQIGDQSNLRSLPSFLLLPWSFAIVCDAADSSLFANYGNVIPVNSLPALNNGGDQVRLKSPSGLVIDSLEFDLTWYNNDVKDDGGFSLELIAPLDPCKTVKQNYMASPSPNGGTPGSINAAFDTIPNLDGPLVTNISVSGEDTLTILFSTKMDSTALVSETYDAGGVTFSILSLNPPNFDEVVLRSTPKIQKGKTYQLPLKTLWDCYGIPMKDTTLEFGIGKMPEPYELVINEFYPDPDPTISPDLPEYEFVELVNISESLLELEGTKLADATIIGVLPKTSLKPGEYIIVVEDANAFFYRPYGKVAPLADFPSLNNTGDRISLRNANGQLLHQIEYTTDWYNDEDKESGGFTIEQIDAEFPCSGISNWAASADIKGGTPGQENSIAGSFSDNSAPTIYKVAVLSDTTLQIEFNEPLDSIYSAQNMQISINPNIAIATNTIINQTTINCVLNTPLLTRTEYTLEVSGIADCAGNTAQNLTSNFGLPEIAELGDLIINEVLANPRRSNGADYVEIYNNSAKYINLESWQIANWDYEEDTIGTAYLVAESPFNIAPKEYLAVSRNSQELLEEYPNANENTLLQIPSLPSFSNDEGSVLLISEIGEITDRFNYTEDLHLAFINDLNGVALERISFTSPTNETTNWTSAAESENFGTPGYENSATTEPNNNESVLSVFPEIFSPDQDGYNDILSINYNFGVSGNVGDISIYSPRGILVKQLVNNYAFAPNGSISWNGEDELGRRAEIGIYVVVCELYDAKGNSEIHKTTCVLGGKL